MSKHCLIIIDLLNEYIDRWDADKAGHLIKATNQLVKAFRSANQQVIWVRQAFMPDLSDAFLEMRDKGMAVTIEGTRGAQLCSGLSWNETDITIVKKRYSAFFGTDLDTILSQIGASDLYLCGINTHACIRTTAIDAYQRDFRVTLAKEGIGSYDEEHARVSLTYMDGKLARISSVADIVALLDAEHP